MEEEAASASTAALAVALYVNFKCVREFSIHQFKCTLTLQEVKDHISSGSNDCGDGFLLNKPIYSTKYSVSIVYTTVLVLVLSMSVCYDTITCIYATGTGANWSVHFYSIHMPAVIQSGSPLK